MNKRNEPQPFACPLAAPYVPRNGDGDADTHKVIVEVPPSLATDFVARCVFPELRPEKARRSMGTRYQYLVTVEAAQALLADALRRRTDRPLPKGLAISLASWIRNIEGSLRDFQAQRTAAEQDPDFAEALRLRTPQLAAFKVDDEALAHWPGSPPERVIVAGAYGLHRVATVYGPFTDRATRHVDPARFDYLFGYIVQCNGRRIFAAAHQLRRPGGAPAHLALVARHGARVQ
ncbi:MAG: hypothetical protein WAP57_13030 [Aquabacterium commune]|uniref:hypothetical protein n=1 Tax=Aquabacterium commune TaxID=70586 RepID=UPI003BAE2D47